MYRQQAGFGFRILSGEPGNPRVSIGDIVHGELNFETNKMKSNSLWTISLKFYSFQVELLIEMARCSGVTGWSVLTVTRLPVSLILT